MAPLARPPMTTCQFFGWQYPLYTGKYLAVIVSVLLALKFNLATYFFNLAYVSLLAAAAAEYSGQLLTGQGFVTKYLGAPQSYATCVKESVLPALGDLYATAEKRIIDIVYVADLEKTLKAAGVAYILHKVTAFVSVYALIWTGVVFMFSFPPFYQTYQDEIDAAVAKYSKVVSSAVHEKVACAKTKLGPMIDQLIEKTGPVGAFIQSKFPTRTAGSTVGESPASAHTKADASSSAAASEPATAFTSGAAKFPEVPATELKSTVADVEEKSPVVELP
ncbi:hypothetical protein PUMCH_003346 [Australozyma saopauloensis]|uniref:Reticulon-like protein n=1 Tax=Australozyma saopauloensis TaxID=291208 RepID=A0AAX4HBP2_9ASCO|nr:hypothetical protein PUMCH_003346 [[Candida] saopauloensis]